MSRPTSAVLLRVQSTATFVSPFSQASRHTHGTYPVYPHVPTSGPSLRNGSVLQFYSYIVEVIHSVKLRASDYITSFTCF